MKRRLRCLIVVLQAIVLWLSAVDVAKGSTIGLESSVVNVTYDEEAECIVLSTDSEYTILYAFTSSEIRDEYMYNVSTARTEKVDLGDGTSDTLEVRDKFTSDQSTWGTYIEPIPVVDYLAGDNGYEVNIQVCLTDGQGDYSDISYTKLDMTPDDIEITLEVAYSEDYTTAVIEVTTESNTAVKQIRNLLTGEVVEGSSADFEVSENSNYIISASNGKCERQETISINEIQEPYEKAEIVDIESDKTGPVIDFENVDTNKNITKFTLIVTATDEDTEVDYIQLPDGRKIHSDSTTFTINENGVWEFRACDIAGNSTTKQLKVNNIASVDNSSDKDTTGDMSEFDSNDSGVFGKLPQTGFNDKAICYVLVTLLVIVFIAGVITFKLRRKVSKNEKEN